MRSKPIILIVEDDYTFADYLGQILKGEGYQTIISYNGEQALIMARQQSPDLILLNVMMPLMDGFEACQRLKNDDITKDIPIIFLTAIDDIDHIIRGYDLGADHYVFKGVHRKVLLAQIRNSLIRVGCQIISRERE